MAKTEKVEKVQDLTKRFRSASGAMFSDFRGLTVKDAVEVRRSLRDAGATFTVAKNTLTLRAAQAAGIEGAEGLLEGPTAISFVTDDPVRGAKALADLSRRFPTLVVKGALVDGRIFGADDARALATLDSKEVSIGKVAGMLQAPVSRMSYLLRAPLQRIAYALADRGRQAA